MSPQIQICGDPLRNTKYGDIYQPLIKIKGDIIFGKNCTNRKQVCEYYAYLFLQPHYSRDSDGIQQDATVAFLFSAVALLHMFRVTTSPIIRSTYAVYGRHR